MSILCGRTAWLLVRPGLTPSTRSLAAKVAKTGGTAAGAKKKIVLEVETDTKNLVNFVCGLNYRIDDERGEEVSIKDDSEYPDWLWSMDMSGKHVPLKDIPHGTIEYYERLKLERIMAYRKNQKSRKNFKYLTP